MSLTSASCADSSLKISVNRVQGLRMKLEGNLRYLPGVTPVK